MGKDKVKQHFHFAAPYNSWQQCHSEFILQDISSMDVTAHLHQLGVSLASPSPTFILHCCKQTVPFQLPDSSLENQMALVGGHLTLVSEVLGMSLILLPLFNIHVAAKISSLIAEAWLHANSGCHESHLDI